MVVEKKQDVKENQEADLKVSYFQIFRYATAAEILATIFGVIFGFLSGLGICYNLVQFGELSTAFVERTSYHEQLSSRMPLTTIFGGGRRLVNASYEENMDAADGRSVSRWP
ncbi:hypothetical protein ACJJTC_006504 [Scirpophaga incertulas]